MPLLFSLAKCSSCSLAENTITCWSSVLYSRSALAGHVFPSQQLYITFHPSKLSLVTRHFHRSWKEISPSSLNKWSHVSFTLLYSHDCPFFPWLSFFPMTVLYSHDYPSFLSPSSSVWLSFYFHHYPILLMTNLYICRYLWAIKTINRNGFDCTSERTAISSLRQVEQSCQQNHNMCISTLAQALVKSQYSSGFMMDNAENQNVPLLMECTFSVLEKIFGFIISKIIDLSLYKAFQVYLYVCAPLVLSVLHGSGSFLACETFGSTRRT